MFLAAPNLHLILLSIFPLSGTRCRVLLHSSLLFQCLYPLVFQTIHDVITCILKPRIVTIAFTGLSTVSISDIQRMARVFKIIYYSNYVIKSTTYISLPMCNWSDSRLLLFKKEEWWMTEKVWVFQRLNPPCLWAFLLFLDKTCFNIHYLFQYCL